MIKNIVTFNDEGSLMVEASIVFPIVVLVIFIIVFICFILYQQTYLQTVVNNAVEKGASSWNDILHFQSEFDNEGYIEDLDENSLYWRIYDSNKQLKIDSIESYIEQQLGLNKNKKINRALNDVVVEVESGLLYKTLVVKITKGYQVPFSKIVNIFGQNDIFYIDVEAKSIIEDTSENLRNTDFVLDIVNEMDKKNEIPQIMNRIKKIIMNFF